MYFRGPSLHNNPSFLVHPYGHFCPFHFYHFASVNANCITFVTGVFFLLEFYYFTDIFLKKKCFVLGTQNTPFSSLWTKMSPLKPI